MIECISDSISHSEREILSQLVNPVVLVLIIMNEEIPVFRLSKVQGSCMQVSTV